MNNHPLPETNPSTTHLQRKERTMTPTLHARKGVLQNGTSGISDRGGYAADETACAITGRGGEHDAGREPGIEQLAFRDPRGQHPTQPIHDGGIRDITEQTIGDGHTVRQPGQARPPREHRFVMGQRLVPNRGSDRHDRGDMETQGHRCALQEPGYPVHRHETATENGNEARSVVFHHARRSIVLGDDIRSTDTHASGMISAAWDGP